MTQSPDAPAPAGATRDFSQLTLAPALLTNLASLGYHQMTPIQAQSLPIMLAGRDVIAQAQTGSGKTAAFALGVLNRLRPERFAVQALILCPTRELADQVAQETRRLARTLTNIKVLALCGGTPIGPQIGSLEHGAHIIVGTPGRVDDHLRKGTLSLAAVETFVLDEADRMLDMGFQAVLDSIVEQLPVQRQNLLFSATYPEQIQRIAERIMQAPAMIRVAAETPQDIDQRFCLLGGVARPEAVHRWLLQVRPDAAMVFCSTKKETDELASYLQQGLDCLALHGDLDQRERDKTLAMFANKSASVLVATDVAARGLDIDAVDLVINMHLAKEPEVHVHRVGRTGRAGASGSAITLFEERERFKLERLRELLPKAPVEVPPPEAAVLAAPGYRAPMATVEIDGGKKQKLRPGDILGALTANGGLAGQDVGKIQLQDMRAYVAVKRALVRDALNLINNGKMKGRKFRARKA